MTQHTNTLVRASAPHGAKQGKLRSETSGSAGFTLVELLLAMAFVGFVLLFIVFAMFQVMGNYNKGIAIKNINQTARSIAEEMSRFVRSTNAEAINVNEVSRGRLCLGGVSYVWNVTSSTTNRYTSGSPVTMVRVEDPAGTLCLPAGGPYPNIDPARATTLVSGQIWVQNVQMTISSNQKLADLTIQLSTSGTNAPTGPGGTCEGGRTGEFCAVASFSTTVSTRNGGQ